MMDRGIPTEKYGVLEQKEVFNINDEALEHFRRCGYTIFDPGKSKKEVDEVKVEFDELLKRYQTIFGVEKLKVCNEHNTIRAVLLFDINRVFLNIALNPVLIEFVEKIIKGRFILNQQNGIINPAREPYNQGKWHRDLPYQHFVTTSPIAINALYCVDDFTVENGATYILPSSHLHEEMPSLNYIKNNAIQISAKAGQYVLIDSMTFHCGGFNGTLYPRRAINHVFTIPFLKQQIKIPGNIDAETLSCQERGVLGFGLEEIQSVDDYIRQRLQRISV
ncbi:phytanoyl-CoA dioxygenase family protein [Aeromonas hydrophila]|uniref:phytanoyl-CoA dioxygenase family protein n=1 Tax=Aeromonas hydrophila TaxID=644 RepID=UPI003D1B86C7|nr:phytanoyl-CoA dioxygenase family protein [Aeromonas hydrophila]